MAGSRAPEDSRLVQSCQSRSERAARGEVRSRISDIRASTPGSPRGGRHVPKKKSVAHIGHATSHPAEQKELLPLGFDPRRVLRTPPVFLRNRSEVWCLISVTVVS